MSFTLRILPRAERDAQNIFDWINDRSPEGAQRWWEALVSEANRVTAFPEAYTRAPESKTTGYDLRQFVLKLAGAEHTARFFSSSMTKYEFCAFAVPAKPR